MSSTTDPAASAPQHAPPPPQGAAPVPFPTDPAFALSAIPQDQLLAILRNVPNLLQGKLPENGNKEDAAQILSNLAQFNQQGQMSVAYPGVGDPGPSTHPRGPPNLTSLATANLAAQLAARPNPTSLPTATVPPPASETMPPDDSGEGSPGGSPSGRRAGRNPAMGTDEWTRLRKDNHKEVERRRRGNINEGINELGRIVPSGSGEKAKGAILSRAVQYIHHLKENESRNIEKWTLEKLLMDQAMGDLQAQLEEVRRMWDDERKARLRAEAEVEALKGQLDANKNEGAEAGMKRRNEGDEDEESTKRQRTE
ncbi:hypothetical protein BD626DRAFT_496024 [Schizophyllum amplum]|uniref:BHLH domain-containing protein n=1 Tax=Schizophyllum amplum TaxID=97359 RepID=A0A550CEK7_9AGAR|nr:hypothetical protein BD626DRAFT_496024 [Auriculariopsis ampla]